jgi:hypothetical protein
MQREAGVQSKETPVIRADMPESVLDGRLGELYAQYLTRFPIAYAYLALVTAAGVLIDRGNRTIRTNLFTCPVGPTGTGKSESAKAAFRLLGMWPTHQFLISGKFGSGEALVERLQDIETGAARFIWVDELAHLLAKCAIERSSFPYILNTAYYEDVQAGGSKGKQFNLNCRLSIAGGIVEELFGDAFGIATTGGLYDRFVFGLCPEPHEFLWRPFEEKPVTLNPFPATVSSDVWDARDEWVRTEGVTSRIAEHALRAAYICACVDGRPTLRANDLGPALEFARYQTGVRKVLAPNPGENPDARCAIAIRNWLIEYAEDGKANRRDLDRGIHASRYGPGVFNRCLNNLAFNREIDLRDGGKTVLVCQ